MWQSAVSQSRLQASRVLHGSHTRLRENSTNHCCVNCVLVLLHHISHRQVSEKTTITIVLCHLLACFSISSHTRLAENSVTASFSCFYIRSQSCFCIRSHRRLGENSTTTSFSHFYIRSQSCFSIRSQSRFSIPSHGHVSFFGPAVA